MSIIISKIAPPFSLSLGEEDGGLFAAVMWPDELGDLPYSGGITAVVVSQGFVLQGQPHEPAIAFLGVSDEVLDDLVRSDVTLMKPDGDDYETKSVRVIASNAAHEFDYSTAIEL